MINNVMLNMRATTITLSILGAIFALYGLAGIGMAVLLLESSETLDPLLPVICFLGLIFSGYCIWFGWIYYSIRERFPFVTKKVFWTTCFVQHSLWVLYLIPLSQLQDGHYIWWLLIWLIPNILISWKYASSEYRTNSNSSTLLK